MAVNVVCLAMLAISAIWWGGTNNEENVDFFVFVTEFAVLCGERGISVRGLMDVVCGRQTLSSLFHEASRSAATFCHTTA